MKEINKLKLQNDFKLYLDDLEKDLEIKQMKNDNVIINLIDLIEDINEFFGLVNINSEVYKLKETIISIIEAPNHTTIPIQLNIEELKDNRNNFISFVIEQYQISLESFDVDEEFIELWSKSFSEQENITPSQFLKILEEDKAYFENAIEECFEIVVYLHREIKSMTNRIAKVI